MANGRKEKRATIAGRPRRMICSQRLSLGQNGAGLVLQRVLGNVDDFEERGVVGRGEIRNDLAVEFALGGNQALDETAVSDASGCLLYTSPSPRDGLLSRMPSSA